jgi:hypothetical protein
MQAASSNVPPTGSLRATGHARAQRDAAFRRVSSITKAITLASVAGALGIAIYVSRALPGHSSVPSTGTATSNTPSTTGGSQPGVSPSNGQGGQSNGSQGGQAGGSLAPPVSPPAQTRRRAPVISGST